MPCIGILASTSRRRGSSRDGAVVLVQATIVGGDTAVQLRLDDCRHRAVDGGQQAVVLDPQRRRSTIACNSPLLDL